MKNSSNGIKKERGSAVLLIFLCWLVYSMSYLGKVNYSANITQIIDFYGVTKAQAGAVPTFFFFAYGIGQVFNGLFCSKYNVKWMVFGSLFVSATINLIIATTSNFGIIKWLWLANGIVLSILWPTLIRLLSESIPKKSLSTSSVAMGTTVATGTIIIYGLSSLYASFGKFKLSFYTASFVVFTVAIIWLLLYNKAVNVSKLEKENEDVQQEVAEVKPEERDWGYAESKILIATIFVLCFCSIGVNLIKDGLTTWVPSILKEEFSMSDSLSILLTLFLPVLAIFGNMFSLKIHKIIPDYINHCAVTFAVIAAFIGVVIGSLNFEFVIFMLIGLIVVNFLASSLNSLVTSIFPLFMRGKVNSGLFAGILNAFCYLGSTISSYGLGAIAENFGWIYVFWTLMGFCASTFVAWAIYTWYRHFVIKKAGSF